jgi:hypothetical protein
LRPRSAAAQVQRVRTLRRGSRSAVIPSRSQNQDTRRSRRRSRCPAEQHRALPSRTSSGKPYENSPCCFASASTGGGGDSTDFAVSGDHQRGKKHRVAHVRVFRERQRVLDHQLSIRVHVCGPERETASVSGAHGKEGERCPGKEMDSDVSFRRLLELPVSASKRILVKSHVRGWDDMERRWDACVQRHVVARVASLRT